MKGKLITLVLFILGTYLIVTSTRDIFGLLQKGNEVEKAQVKLEKVLAEKKVLESELDYAQSNSFIEKEARDKLGMSKPGETNVILPPNLDELMKPKPIPTPELPNWKLWLNLFF